MINHDKPMDLDGFRRYPFFSQIQWAISETPRFHRKGLQKKLGRSHQSHVFYCRSCCGGNTGLQASKICRSKPFGCDWSPQRPCFSSTCCLQSLMVCEEYLGESLPRTTILDGYIIIIIIIYIIYIGKFLCYSIAPQHIPWRLTQQALLNPGTLELHVSVRSRRSHAQISMPWSSRPWHCYRYVLTDLWVWDLFNVIMKTYENCHEIRWHDDGKLLVPFRNLQDYTSTCTLFFIRSSSCRCSPLLSPP